MSGVIRIEHDRDRPYVIVSKALSEDRRLTFALRGVLIYLLGKPDNWTTYVTEVENAGGEGREAMKAIFAEGRRYGYIRTIEHRTQGKLSYEHIIYEKPLAEPIPDILTPDGQPSSIMKRQQKAAAKTVAGKPSTGSRQREAVNGEPSTESRHVISNDSVSNDQQVKPPSTAHAAGGEAETGNPVTEVPKSQQPEPAISSQVQDQATASAEPSTATDLEKVPGAAAGAARPLTEHQAMMDAIRATLYPQSERCADSIEKRMAAASKELRSAGLGPDAPAGIHAYIRTEQSWRRAVTPETLVQVSADWANARAPRSAPAPTPTPDAQPKKGGFLR